jgi:hypothetical protein
MMVTVMMMAARLRVCNRRQNCTANNKQRNHQKQAAGKLFQ